METRALTRKTDVPLLNEELPFSGIFHPLGFHLNLSTNSREVLECANESWGMWSPEFPGDPVEVRVIVQEEGDLALEPEYRARGHLFSMVSDRHNYGVIDLDRLFAYAFVSRKTVSDHVWFRWFFLDPLGLFTLAQRHAMALHAACVARDGRGILLAGLSCSGKSTLSWACARAGWTFVGDDASWLPMNGNGREVLGWWHKARFRHDAPELFPELQRYVSRIRPNGKLNIEVPTSAFPNIRAQSRCAVEAVVFLDRSGRHEAGMETMDAANAARELLSGPSLHRPEIVERYREVVRRLLQVPAYRMRYKSLEEGIALLGDLHERLRS